MTDFEKIKEYLQNNGYVFTVHPDVIVVYPSEEAKQNTLKDNLTDNSIWTVRNVVNIANPGKIEVAPLTVTGTIAGYDKTWMDTKPYCSAEEIIYCLEAKTKLWDSFPYYFSKEAI